MSERKFGVVLSARVDQYVAAMRAARAESVGFSSATEASLSGVGQKMQNVGRGLTTFVSLPLAAVGVGAVKMSMDFEGAFSKMVGLAGIPKGEVDSLKESVLNLSKETGTSAQSLADALYFASSAGLSTADAMDAVDVAAHASAAGMGAAEDVVGLVASAMSSYGAENINAAEATDILTASIRAGRADPDELAGSLGRVLPMAAALGVEFKEVGGVTAYLSNIFGDTGRTVTSLSGILNKIAAPTKQGKEELEKYGLSAKELKRIIDEDGLVAGLEYLKTNGFDKNTESVRKLFDDVEAFQGALALLNDKSGTLATTMGAVADSSGALGEAFNEVADDQGFKMKQAFETLRVAMIQAGDIIIPLVADIAGWIAKLVEVFTSLPEPLQKVLLGLGGIAIAAGPLLNIAGKLVENLGSLVGTALKLGPALLTMGPYLLAAAAAGAIAFSVWNDLTWGTREVARRTAELRQPLEDATNAIIDEYHAAVDAAGSAEGLALAHKALSQALTETGGDGERLTLSLGALGHQAEDAASVLIDLQKDPVAAMRALARETGATAEEAAKLTDKVLASEKPFWGVAEANEWLTPKLTATGKAMEEMRDQAQNTDLNALASSMLNAATAASPLNESLIHQAEKLEGAGAEAWEVYERYVDLAAASDEVATEHQKAAAGAEAVTAATAGVGDAAAGAATDVQVLSTEELDAQAAAQGMKMAFLDYQKVVTGADWGAAGLTGATTAFDGYRERLFGTGNWLQGKTATWKAFSDAVGDGALNLDVTTEAGGKTQDALENVSQVIDGQLAAAWQASNGDMDVFRASAAEIANVSLTELATQAGLSEDEVVKLGEALGLTPETVETRILLAGSEEARVKLGLLQGMITTLPPDTQLKVTQQIIAGDWVGAVNTIQAGLDEMPTVEQVETMASTTEVGGTVGDIQTHLDQNHVRSTVDTIVGDLWGARTKTQDTYNQNHVRLWSDTQAWDIWGAHYKTQQVYDQNHVRAPVDSKASDTGGAWWDIQNWFNRNPVQARVKAAVSGFFAGGTDFAPGGMAIVGERGPELVNLPRGSQVSTAAETRSLLASRRTVTGTAMAPAMPTSMMPAAASSGGSVHVEVRVEGNIYGDSALRRSLDDWGAGVAQAISQSPRRF